MRVLKFALIMVGAFVAIVAAGWLVLTFWWVLAIIASIVIANELVK